MGQLGKRLDENFSDTFYIMRKMENCSAMMIATMKNYSKDNKEIQSLGKKTKDSKLDEIQNKAIINHTLAQWGGCISDGIHSTDYGKPYEKCFSEEEMINVDHKVEMISSLIDRLKLPNSSITLSNGEIL